MKVLREERNFWEEVERRREEKGVILERKLDEKGVILERKLEDRTKWDT